MDEFEINNDTHYLEVRTKMNLTDAEFTHIEHECSHRCRAITDSFYENTDSVVSLVAEELGAQKYQVYLGLIKQCAKDTIDARVNTYIEMCRELGKFPDGDDMQMFISVSKPYVVNKVRLFSEYRKRFFGEGITAAFADSIEKSLSFDIETRIFPTGLHVLSAFHLEGAVADERTLKNREIVGKASSEANTGGDGFSDRQLMERAIALSRNCTSEDVKPRPKVGAIIARDGVIIGEGFRGELAPGEHGEFTVLEKKLPDSTLAGATLFTTLEPCTSRNHPKIPCADRIIERRIKKVVIGILDRNPRIQGEGFWRLWDAGIEVSLFDADLMAQVDELNREFFRQYRDSPTGVEASPNFFAARTGGSISLTGGGEKSVTEMVYIYDSELGRTITSVNLAVFVEIVNLKPIPTRISKYTARILLTFPTEAGEMEEWHPIYRLPSSENNVFYILEGNWEKTKRFDFAKTGFDSRAAEMKLETGDVVSGWMLFETNHKIRNRGYEIMNIELTIEDIVGDKQVFMLDGTLKAMEGESLLNPGDIQIAGGYFDLTKEQFVISSRYDIGEKVRHKNT